MSVSEPGERRLRILGRLTAGGVDLDPQRVCEMSAELTGVTGAGILLMPSDLPLGSVGASDAVAATLGRLQHDLGEGPGIDAHEEGRPVEEPELALAGPRRWVAFTGPALEAGAEAVFAFPLQVGPVRLGAVNLYRDAPGSLSGEAFADAEVLADIAAQSLLAASSMAPEGEFADAVAQGSDFQLVVHQAAGMMSVQLGTSVADALARLRAHAFVEGRPVRDVARDVVSRLIRFNPDEES